MQFNYPSTAIQLRAADACWLWSYIISSTSIHWLHSKASALSQLARATDACCLWS